MSWHQSAFGLVWGLFFREKCDFLEAVLLGSIGTWVIAKCPKCLHECFKGLLARNLWRPESKLERVRPPLACRGLRCPSDTIVLARFRTRYLVADLFEIRKIPVAIATKHSEPCWYATNHAKLSTF